MTFAQRLNRLTTHFSERIPVVKRLIFVLQSVQWRGYGLCRPMFDSRRGRKIFSFPKYSYKNWGPPSLQPSSTRRPGREHKHSHSMYADVKNEWLHTSNSEHALIAWTVTLILFGYVMYCTLVFPTNRSYVIYICWHACQYTAHLLSIDVKVVHVLAK